jgi:hypothetical protein
MPALRAILLVALLTPLRSAVPADWDHDRNIEAAVLELSDIYREGGVQRAAAAVEACYGGLPGLALGDDRLRRLEYCAGMDYTGYYLDRAAQDAELRDEQVFFAPTNLRMRLTALRQFVADPNVENQILRAWGRAAADALDKQVR